MEALASWAWYWWGLVFLFSPLAIMLTYLAHKYFIVPVILIAASALLCPWMMLIDWVGDRFFSKDPQICTYWCDHVLGKYLDNLGGGSDAGR